jgi:hypothetical protein
VAGGDPSQRLSAWRTEDTRGRSKPARQPPPASTAIASARRVAPVAGSREDAYVQTREVPEHILDQLLVGLVFYEAELTLEHFEPGGTALIGDSFGSVFTWLWRENPGKATVLVADFVAQLRFYHHNANRDLRLDAVLRGLPAALRGVPDEEVSAMQERLRSDVPGFVDPTDC